MLHDLQGSWQRQSIVRDVRDDSYWPSPTDSGTSFELFYLKDCSLCQVQSSNTPSSALQSVKENINFVPCGTLCERSREKGESITLYPWTLLDVKFPVKNVNSVGRAYVWFKCNGNALGRKCFRAWEFGTVRLCLRETIYLTELVILQSVWISSKLFIMQVLT